MRADPLDPPTVARSPRSLHAGTPEVEELCAADGVVLRLTRHRGGSKGPVVLSHCIGVSSLMYAHDVQETNLLEYLWARGWDVWLLDHRLSIALDAARRASTLDDVARFDYPAAVARVRERTDRPSVQVVAHGVGSSTLTMALLWGLQGVRAAVCSQVSTHLSAGWDVRVKAGLRLPNLLAALGHDTTTARVDATADWKERVYAKVLEAYPIEAEERCGNPVCHRITSIYGLLFEHDRLGPAHEYLHELFGVVSVEALRHLSRMARVGHVVAADGAEDYLPHLQRLALPILLISGAENACVLPVSTSLSYDLLCNTNGQELYVRHEVPGYGHVDCILGEHAARDVFPLIHDHLERTA